MARGGILILAECYANTCIAHKLRKILVNKLDVSISVNHKFIYGRDRVLKDANRIAEREVGVTIAVIDYEMGVGRSYIDMNFKLEKLRENLLVGRSIRTSNLLAIIFNPHVEAFICKTVMRCHEVTVDQFKSRDACNKLKEILEDKRMERVVEEIAGWIVKSLTL